MEHSVFLKNTIKAAGALALEYRGKLKKLKVESKASSKDIVTEADKGIESFIREEIRKSYPEYAYMGEEEGIAGNHDYCWIVDPIDGTVSFLHEQPFFSISIALEYQGELVMGAVYAPVLDELFFAEKGSGATLNGEPVSVSSEDVFERSVVCTGFACLRSNLEKNNLPIFSEIAPRVRGIRRLGSAALELCYVGAGRLEAYWEPHLNLYDVAAGTLVCREAGGTVSDYKGGPLDPEQVLASNGRLHDHLISLIGKHL